MDSGEHRPTREPIRIRAFATVGYQQLFRGRTSSPDVMKANAQSAPSCRRRNLPPTALRRDRHLVAEESFRHHGLHTLKFRFLTRRSGCSARSLRNLYEIEAATSKIDLSLSLSRFIACLPCPKKYKTLQRFRMFRATTFEIAALA